MSSAQPADRPPEPTEPAPDTGAQTPPAGGPAQPENRAVPSGKALVVRPRKIRKVAWTCAVVLVAAFTVVAILLRNTPTGVYFHPSDQISMVLLGFILAGMALLFTRPRLRIESDGIEVRNVLTTRKYLWPEINAVAFPEGAAWARLELPDDEYITIMAIQATDGAYAVKAMRALRAAYRKAAAQ